VIVLSNSNVDLPDAIGMWALDRLLDNPAVDYVAAKLKDAKSNFLSEQKSFAKPEHPRPFPPLAPLAGRFASPAFGKALLRPDGDALVLELEEVGAHFALAPWDGDIFTIRLLPRGRFVPVVANLAERPMGFAQFEIGKDGKLGLLRLTLDDG
jgi:hypothetical protein